MLEDRTCLNDFCKLLQTSISTDAMSAKPKLTTLCKEVTLENTVQWKTFRTLIEMKNFLHQFYQEVMLFKKMCFVFTVTFPTLKRSHGKVTWLCTKLHYTYTCPCLPPKRARLFSPVQRKVGCQNSKQLLSLNMWDKLLCPLVYSFTKKQHMWCK